MLTSTRKERAIVAKLDAHEVKEIKAFIQGSVYCFCKNYSDSWFAAKNLFGGENKDWGGTPLQKLYDWHIDNGASDPSNMAAKDVGWLLLAVIIKDEREFEIREEYANEYKWNKES